jgi:hypothetical protein
MGRTAGADLDPEAKGNRVRPLLVSVAVAAEAEVGAVEAVAGGEVSVVVVSVGAVVEEAADSGSSRVSAGAARE